MADKKRVVLIGATGLFGGLLAQRFANEGEFELIACGRRKNPLEALSSETGVTYRLVDRDNAAAVDALLQALNPFAVVDCSGPFQFYEGDPYRFARQVINAGAHYLDIADCADFVSGIHALDEVARKNNVVAISGASTTPAISSAVCEQLTKDMGRVISIDTAIIPGNRARRTYSVMKAILGQIGQRFSIKQNGQETTVRGWSDTRSIDLDVKGKPVVNGRLASLVNTPDAALLPSLYEAETVRARAGLEVKLFHHALGFGGLFVRWRILPSLAPFTGLIRWTASWFEWMGTDAGGMQVAVVGETSDGQTVERHWDLVASDGNGPHIPTLPVSIILEQLNAGEVQAGARACTGEISLLDVEKAVATIDGGCQASEQVLTPIFKAALGAKFDELPEIIQAFHSGFGASSYAGKANVRGPSGVFGYLIARLFGFPAGGEEMSVEVTKSAEGKSELWQRDFNGKVFRSHLRLNEQVQVEEKFGPLSFTIGLDVKDGKLIYPVTKGRAFGIIPMPKFLLPKSIAHETVDEKGRFRFDVLLKAPFGGRIAHYQGWLVKRDP